MIFEEKKIFKIFIDFDGTISTTDVGEEFFLKFGNKEKAREIVRRWIDKEINSRESWILLCETIKNYIPNEFENFIDSIKIDEHFKSFADLCNKNGFDIFIVSDGFNYYIDRILKNNGLDYIPRFYNRLEFGEKGEFIPVFPFPDEECKKCANCKRNHILNNSGDNEFTIFIGDGYSDTCPAQFCDFIFAKQSLLKFCEINRISFFPYSNFSDVKKRVESMLLKKKLKKRHQAELKRKEIYSLG
ncbi:MAG: MtnX-like HAD-IB family phosphatase [Ignavibacteria bacterium]|nr:MtnX-like HAD-IB family phosphatase [Ignavibacteria bacterium]